MVPLAQSETISLNSKILYHEKKKKRTALMDCARLMTFMLRTFQSTAGYAESREVCGTSQYVQHAAYANPFE